MLNIDISAKPLQHIGVGYKSLYFEDLIEPASETVGWLEVHAENYMMAGGPRKEMMQELAKRYPISCHGVGLSIGAEIGLDQDHINRLKELMTWLNPSVFSEHLAWSTHSSGFLNDLLPLPYTKNVLDRVSDHIKKVQDELGRQMLLENPSSYLAFAESEMAEHDFIAKVVDQTGCALLLDVNNVFVSANNLAYDPHDYIDKYPTEYVAEIHLGGHEDDTDDKGQSLLIDAHNNPVIDPVWDLYDYTLKQTGITPVLIEWDNDLPTWATLLNEARQAADILAPHLQNVALKGSEDIQRDQERVLAHAM